ncbi:MAG: uroporphyrinogen-III synthase [Candidatus Portiera sp.]|nr:uroporphyrinogen-III synthase [Portiera sp.]
MPKHTILIPRPASSSTTQLISELEQRGLAVIKQPLISIQQIQPIELRSYTEICSYDWLVCVSEKAVKFWVDAIVCSGKGFDKQQILKGLPPIWVPGATTAECVRQHGGEARIPEGSGSPAIYKAMLNSFGDDPTKLKEQKILIICGKEGGKEFARLLGRSIDKELVYQTNSFPVSYEAPYEGTDEHPLFQHGNVSHIWITSKSILNVVAALLNQKPCHISYNTTKLIVGSPRLELLAKDIFAGEREVIGLAEPTNQALLNYFDSYFDSYFDNRGR